MCTQLLSHPLYSWIPQSLITSQWEQIKQTNRSFVSSAEVCNQCAPNKRRLKELPRNDAERLALNCSRCGSFTYLPINIFKFTLFILYLYSYWAGIMILQHFKADLTTKKYRKCNWKFDINKNNSYIYLETKKNNVFCHLWF